MSARRAPLHWERHQASSSAKISGASRSDTRIASKPVRTERLDGSFDGVERLGGELAGADAQRRQQLPPPGHGSVDGEGGRTDDASGAENAVEATERPVAIREEEQPEAAEHTVERRIRERELLGVPDLDRHIG